MDSTGDSRLKQNPSIRNIGHVSNATGHKTVDD